VRPFWFIKGWIFCAVVWACFGRVGLDSIARGLLATLKFYGYDHDAAAKDILRTAYPDLLVKRGNPPTYGRNL